MSYFVLLRKYMVSQHTCFDHVWCYLIMISILFFNFAFMVYRFWSNECFWLSRFSFVNLKEVLWSDFVLNICWHCFWSLIFSCEFFFAHHFDRVWPQACNNIKLCDALSYLVLFWKYMVLQHKYFEHVWLIIL